MATTEEIDAYVQLQVKLGDVKAKNATTNRVTTAKYAQRSTILKLLQAVRGFQSGQDPRWIAVLGLRGVGKTTMLSQLFQNIQTDQHRKLFVALDDAKDNLGIGVREIAAAYERTLGKRFEELTEPVYLFFDEIHFDPQWALTSRR
jgi:predicted AAA+ superfamily ATPase